MTPRERDTLDVGSLVDYFVRAFKPRDGWLVGMEMEKIGVDRETGERIPYADGRATVLSVLEEYLDGRGGTPVREGGHLIGLDGSWGTISLEPGGQVEWSSRPRPDLDELDADLREHLRELDRVGEMLGIRWLDVAVDPDHPVERMPWMPKTRYKIMRPHMGARGRLAHRMMTQTASIQCAFDFESAEDWTRKFRAGALLAPIMVALTANSSRVDGRETGFRSFRQAIWRETDPDRCGLPAVVFEPGFGIEAWVRWAIRVPTMFRRGAHGLVPSGGVPFADLMRAAGRERIEIEEWELHLSSLFTEVRSYSHVEIRSADLVPDSLVLGVPAFWTGILYHPDSLEGALELGAGHDNHAAWTEAMDSAARHGLDGAAGGRPLGELARRALALAESGLRSGAACAGTSRALPALHALAERNDLKV